MPEFFHVNIPCLGCLSNNTFGPGIQPFSKKSMKFAEVFDVPVANLFQVIITKEDKRSELEIEQLSTRNETFVITKIESKK